MIIQGQADMISVHATNSTYTEMNYSLILITIVGRIIFVDCKFI